jgi:HAD superfamily hydrolase (TIGR01459 family)
MPYEFKRFGDIVSNYDVFAFSIFGVLHNGHTLNTEALSCLERLASLEKSVALFSNVPQRRSEVIQALNQIGISPALYQHVITAGEETWRHLKTRHDPYHAALGDRCFCIGTQDMLRLLDDLPIHRVGHLDQADFVLVLGADEWHPRLEDYSDLLEEASEINLPMVCADPDRFVNSDQELFLRAGAIAKLYETLGGVVYYHGKPEREFYTALMHELSPVDKSRVLMVGSALNTDILGANRFGMDSVLYCTETTQYELGLNNLSAEEISQKIKTVNLRPTYMMRSLSW